jgi:hypothetical protein
MRRILGHPSATKQTVAVCLAFSVLLGLLLLTSRDFHFPMQLTKSHVGTDADRRLGEIRFAPAKDGRCRSIKFDNQSGQLGEEKMIDCDTDPTGNLAPFEAIRKSFKGR